MRICLYTETALPKIGGQELVVDALARQLSQPGLEVVVLAPRPRHSPAIDDSRLPYRVVRHRRLISTWRLIRWYRQELIKLHREFPFDVLHCHSVHPCGYLGALCKEDLGIALVLTSHGGDVREGNVRLGKPGSLARFALALRKADAAVSIGRFTTQALRRLEPGVRIAEIPNGVDLEPFAAEVRRPPTLDSRIHSGGYLLFLGRLHSRKGVDVLLRAWAAWLGGAGASMQRMLVVAGDGEERESLQKQAIQLGIDRKVHFTGRVTGDDKTWLLQHASAVCLPSRQWEAFPLVVLEAFAAGKPVIGTRIPGLEDQVEPGRTGWLVSPDSPDELAVAISEMWSDASGLRRFQAEVRRAAIECSWPRVAARHIELYSQFVGRRRAKAA